MNCIKVQDPNDAYKDVQIKTLTPFVHDVLSKTTIGTIIDYGCGKGILFQRLCSIQQFIVSKWVYIGVDVIEDLSDEIDRIAKENKIRRRSDFFLLDDFAKINMSEALIKDDFPRPLLFVCRNVLHELSIADTAHFLFELVSKCELGESVVIQDLYTFPEIEQKNAPWEPDILCNLLSKIGFSGGMINDDTARGNTFFTYKGSMSSKPCKSIEEIQDYVYENRTRQFSIWTKKYKADDYHNKLRDEKKAVDDFTYQYAALALIVNDYKPISGQIDDTTSNYLLLDIVSKCNDKLHNNGICGKLYESNVIKFRDRAQDQDHLTDFIVGVEKVAIVQGAPLIGKTSLIKEVLCKAQEKTVVSFDMGYSSSIWNVIEELYSSIGVKLNIQPLLQGYKSPVYDHVKDVINDTLLYCSSKCIFVLDHFDRILDHNNRIISADIAEFFNTLVSFSGVKVIIVSDKDLSTHSVLSSFREAIRYIKVQRFPKGKHVPNVLDDYIDRSSIHLAYYPEEIIEAIDNLPYLATLAGKIIAKEGMNMMDDRIFIHELRNRMKRELLNRLVTTNTMPIVRVITVLRLAVPLSFFEAFACSESISEAIQFGLLYREYRFNEIEYFSGAKVLMDQRFNAAYDDEDTITSNSSDSNVNIHKQLSDSFRYLYKKDREPKWLRESYYHIICTGDKSIISQFGVLYCDEFYDAGCIWQYKHDYKRAEFAFETAFTLGSTKRDIQIKRAATKMRTGKITEAIKLYEESIARYVNWTGAKSSYIDSYLAIKRFSEALNLLINYGVNYLSKKDYTQYQYAKAYLGLHDYNKAKYHIEKAIGINNTETYIEIRLLVLRKLGLFAELKKALEEARRYYPNSIRIAIDYASYLIQNKEQKGMDEAERILLGILNEQRGEGFALKQLCKLYGFLGDKNKAMQIYKEHESYIKPQWMQWTITFEVMLAQGKWQECLDVIAQHRSKNDINALCYEKKVYLYWSVDITTTDQKGIAQSGLDINIPDSYKKNIPLMVMQAKLARLAEANEVYNETIEDIRKTNPQIAEEVDKNNSESDYEEVFFDK